MNVESNATKLVSFSKYVESLKPVIKRQYDRNVNRDLSQQNAENLFKRNIDAVLQQTYEDSLKQLRQMSFDTHDVSAETGVSSLTSNVLGTFNGVIEELFQYALHKHRTSCALSNFPDEHNPSQEYLAVVIQDTDLGWQAFSLQVKTLLSC